MVPQRALVLAGRESGEPMKIVVVDGHTANPGDLSWESFRRLGEVIVHERSTEDEIVERVQGAEALVTNKALVTAKAIQSLPSLRYIGVTATGFNNVDVAAAKARGIPVCNVPEYGTQTVAQATFALVLELTNRVGHHAETVRAGRWSQSKDFCYWDHPLIELSGLTLGIVGYGRIGSAVAEIGRAFGMTVLNYRRNPVGSADEVDASTLLRRSDVVSLHCPLTPETKHWIHAGTLDQMKRTAFLINTSRGGLVHEMDLASALNSGRLAGAGLDVLSIEPPSAEHPLVGAKNCLITPHIAWATRAARHRLIEAAAENLHAFQEGRVRHVVNP